MNGLLVKVQWDFEQATGMAGEEKYHGDDELCE